MQRPSAEYQVLPWPKEIWPQKAGAVAVPEGAGRLDPNGRSQVRAAQETNQTRPHLQPRCRPRRRETISGCQLPGRRPGLSSLPAAAVYLPHAGHLLDVIGTVWSPAAALEEQVGIITPIDPPMGGIDR